jgi:Domain of Unknown Function (DUF1080)
MKKATLPILLIALTGLAFAEDNVPPAGFTALFDGKQISGWYGWGTRDPRDLLAMTPEAAAAYKKQSVEGGTDAKGKAMTDHINAHWKVENGELVNDGKGLYLTTEKEYGDFELLVDYKMQPKGDSGIYLRGVPQVQIWDYTKEGGKWNLGADKGSGGLWNNSPGAPGKDPLVLADKPFGEWNSFRIRQVGARTWVWLNDKLTVDGNVMENYWDRTKPLPAKGPIMLQTHGGEIRWRNLFVHETGADEAKKILSEAPGK